MTLGPTRHRRHRAPPYPVRARRSHGCGPVATDPARWDDYVLAALLLVISVPRAVIALISERPLGVGGTLSMFLVLLALLMLRPRRRA